MNNEWLDEVISCEYCAKEVRVRDMKNWIKLAEVSEDMESNPMYFCSDAHLRNWINENECMSLIRRAAIAQDRQWRQQEKKE